MLGYGSLYIKKKKRKVQRDGFKQTKVNIKLYLSSLQTPISQFNYLSKKKKNIKVRKSKTNDQKKKKSTRNTKYEQKTKVKIMIKKYMLNKKKRNRHFI